MHKSTAEIRQAFLDFFYENGHQLIEGHSLVPNNDPTLLFTNAGMNQFKDIFLGLDKRSFSRVATSQHCIRAGGKHNDLENIGYTVRHHTFFEMLGNFSFGDYFKHEAINYAWELLTGKKWFNLPKEKLWITVYKTDDESFRIWQKCIGVSTDRIIRIGDKKGVTFSSDNFWQMGDTGPCGPCTEIFYDHGDHICGGPPGSIKEDGDRYVEIWNIVFIQFNRQSDGVMLPLSKPSVDTGMGLERIAAVLQNVHSNYEIDLFRILIADVAKVTNTIDLKDKSLRVIADHIRSCAYLISDGIIPSNEGRGYVLRRIIRRAIRHGNMLGVKELFFYKLVAPLIKVMGSEAKDLKRQQSLVEQVLKIEEEQFLRTLEGALTLLNNELDNLQGPILDGDIAFRLYDTFGFPFDLTVDVCYERGKTVDKVRFKEAMEAQRTRARKSSNFNLDYNTIIRIDDSSQFSGYSCEKQEAIVVDLFQNGHSVKKINAGEEGVVVLNITPFYGESGGQVGDQGVLKGTISNFIVSDTQRYGKAIGHLGKISHGLIKINDRVNAQIDSARRNRICLNHSATHLLHAALRQILGHHVVQKGSLVHDQYLRFDFLHHEAMKYEQIFIVDDLVNKWVRCNLPIKTDVMPIDDAKDKGAIALFSEKYPNHVRVLTIGDLSTELCTGTHVSRTGDIGLFHILSESSAASGVRRIEAVTGASAIYNVHKQSDLLKVISNLLKSDNRNLLKKLNTILDRTRVLEKELKKLKDQEVEQKIASLSSQVKIVYGIKVLVSLLDNIEEKMLRIIVNNLKNKLRSVIVVLATINANKVSLISGVTTDLTDKVSAEELILYLAKQVNCNGGGCSVIAQASGKDIGALPKALNNVIPWIASKT